MFNFIYIYYLHLICGKEIKLSFQVLRVSCKHLFTFFSLIITDFTFCLQCIGFLLFLTMFLSAVFDANAFNLNLFWWQQCEVISDRLFKIFLSCSSRISNFF